MASNNNNNVDTSVQISTQSDRKSLPFDSQSNVNAMVTIKAPQYSASSRAPLDLVTVLDRSGSMGGEKMDLLKKTMKCVIQELSSKDRLSIVTFDNMLETNLSLRFMDEQGKAAALRAMDSVNARGGTNLCAGVCEGMKVMRERKEKSEVTSIWVLTDGLTNEGLTRKEDIIKAMHNPEFQLNLGRPILSNVGYMPMQFMQQQQQPFPQQQIPQLPSPQLPILQLPIPPPTPNSYNHNNLQTGLPPKAKIMLEEDEKEKNKSNNNNNEKPELPLPGTLHTFGFGSDHDSNMLKALAEHGNGMYYFIKDANKISETFADCLGGLLSTTSQNIELTLEPMNGVTITNVMGKYKKEEEGARVKLFLGDLQSDERRDIVFSLDIPSVPERFAEFNVLKANLKYQDVIQNVPKLASIELKLKRPDVAEPETPNIELDRNLNRLKSADAMSYSADLAAKGKMDQAREAINKCIRAIQESVSKSDPFCVSLLSDLQTTLSGLKDSVTFQNYGQQAMHTNVMSHYAQRQAGPQASYSSAQQAYTTTNRSVVTSHFH